LEPLASIASVKVQNFVFRQIVCRFGIPAEVICDNGTQLTYKEFREMLARLYIKQYFASVEHPQSNDQAESANKVILNGLRKRFEKVGASWIENLYQVLWSYRTTPYSTTGETSFRMLYGSDAVIPVEIGQPSWLVIYPAEKNEQLLREDSDMIDEVREVARIKEIYRKQ
jgi:transposase InsO family protein